MNFEERKHVQKLMVVLAEVYNRQISQAAIGVMADALMDLDGAAVVTALKKYISDPNSKGFPMPGQIRSMVSPEMSSDQLAVEAASKIVEAMAKFGWTNADNARTFMGEIAWDVVTREGGWTALCERTNNDDLPFLKSQWRELAKVVAIRHAQKQSIALTGPTEKKQIGGDSE